MLLGIKSKKTLFLRHSIVGVLAVTAVYLFWLSRPEFSSDVRLWRALADSAFSFLFITLAIGPAAKLWPPAQRLIPWRRETGIWFVLLALGHFTRVFNYALTEPGLELSNLLGLTALFLALLLMATSSDRAVAFLGTSAWKWLHQSAHVIFYLVAFHAGYLLFLRYPETNWFQYPFLVMVLTLIALRVSAFVKTVRGQRATSRRPAASIKKMDLPIAAQKIIAEHTAEVTFDLSGQDFNFEAGQYIQMRLPKLMYPDPKGASRTFSIASSPSDRKILAVAFRDSGSGFKRTLLALPRGTLITIEGPYGFFTLPRDPAQLIVFIAGGIGITPCLSMIRFIGAAQLVRRVILLYANRDRESAAYLEELEELERRHPWFVLKNKFGRIDGDFIKSTVKDFDNVAWYVVGPPPMVAATRDLLSRLGISEEIYFEDFIGYE